MTELTNTSAPFLLSSDLPSFIGGKGIDGAIRAMRLLGAWTTEHDRRLESLLQSEKIAGSGLERGLLATAERYFAYRNSSDQLVYICADEAEFLGLRNVEQRCEGVPFTIHLGILTTQGIRPRSSEIDQALMEHCKASTENEITVYGFHKP